MNSRLYNKIHEHFQHLIPRSDLGAQERLAKNEEEAKKWWSSYKWRKWRDCVFGGGYKRGCAIEGFYNGGRLADLAEQLLRSSLNPNGSYDVQGDVNCNSLGIYSILDIAAFGVVEGDFDCSDNYLTSLEGAPEKCENFYCSNNQLIALEHAPLVCAEFDCSDNQLTSLKGGPIIYDRIWCFDNRVSVSQLLQEYEKLMRNVTLLV